MSKHCAVVRVAVKEAISMAATPSNDVTTPKPYTTLLKLESALFYRECAESADVITTAR